jgi:hypothetical protein
MIRKLLLVLSGVTLLAAVTTGSAYARPALTTSPLVVNGPQASSITEICAQGGSGYCLNDWNAVSSGDAVKMYNSGVTNDNFGENLLTGYCNGGHVTDGVHSPGPACPFVVGSGYNSAYEGDQMIEIISNVSGACIGTDEHSIANLGPCPPTRGGVGSNIWVLATPECGTLSGTYYYINVYWSNSPDNSDAASLQSGGAIGNNAYVVGVHDTSCWRYENS